MIDDSKLTKEFCIKDLENLTTGDDRNLWRKIRDEIAIGYKSGRKTLYTLKEGSAV